MGSFPEWATRFYELYSEPYLPNSEAARTRVEQGLPRILKHLPRKGSKVLDLCCGGGAYLFPLEKAGYTMTGVDIQQTMINEAKKVAKRTKSTATLIVGNASKLRFKDGVFDAVVFLGAPFGHFSLGEFRAIAKEAYRVLRHRGLMVTEVNDHIALFLSGMYQRILYEPSGTKDIVSIHTRYDSENGAFNRLFLNLETNRRFKGSFHIWSPWILNYVMDNVGFKAKASEQGAFGYFSRLSVHTKP